MSEVVPTKTTLMQFCISVKLYRQLIFWFGILIAWEERKYQQHRWK